MRRVVALFLGVCISIPAFGQSTDRVSVDQRVRITTDGATHVGQVVAVAPESLRLAIDGRDPVTIATPAIRRIEVSRGRASKWKTDALRGAIVFGGIGAALLPLQREEAQMSIGESVALGAWSGGLFGGLIGAAIGASKSADRWEQVWP